MNRNLSLGLGVLAFALLPAFAQTPAPTGTIHGHVTSVTGFTVNNGTVSLSTDGGPTSKYTFPVSTSGEYRGEAAPGTYTLVYRDPNTKNGQMTDQIKNVKVVAGQDTVADDDMTRKEFMDALTPEQKKQLEDIKKKNAEAMSINKVIAGINADLHTIEQDVKDAEAARETAHQLLGASASRGDLEAKENEIKTARYGEVETLMLKDTAAKPDVSILWARLCKGQLGLKKYDEAEASCKKAIEVDQAAKKPNLQWQGLAQAELGEVYARTGKDDDAKAAFDLAAKDDPTQAALNLKNEAVIFSQLGKSDAQVAAAEAAIAIDPKQPLPYYLKGNGLVGKTAMDEKTHKLVPPDGCIDAYKKYLELAPTGLYAAEVKGILAGFEQTIDTSYKATKGKK